VSYATDSRSVMTMKSVTTSVRASQGLLRRDRNTARCRVFSALHAVHHLDKSVQRPLARYAKRDLGQFARVGPPGPVDRRGAAQCDQHLTLNIGEPLQPSCPRRLRS